jgi:hypothetical protein
VARDSFCVVRVIVGSVIAAWRVAHRRGRSNGVRPANAISAVPPDASIIVTGSALIAAAWPRGNRLKYRLPTRRPLHLALPLTKKT